MKKIININLNGRVIPIEDTAYEKLQAYIESLRKYFAKEESRDEIINDIESRIAELLHEKVRKGAGSITDADIDEVATSMGRPEDFEAEDATENATTHSAQQEQSNKQQYSYSEKKTKGRLYRDTGDKFIGGVCSGIAAYLNVDPAIVRILFAIITFGGFGLGFLAYIILWIVLPAKDIDGYSGKRFFRNPDDKVIGGVAGGLAAYFNKSSNTIRLIFAAPLVLSVIFSMLEDFDFFPNIVFGSMTGTFILAYVVLWIVLPEARTPYEKMEMRGEKVDVNTIRQNVKEGAENIKEKMKGWTDEVKESAQNFSSKAKEFSRTRGKEFGREIGETARRTGSGLGHAIGVLFKVFFLFIAGTIAFGLFVGLMALLFSGVIWWPINDFLWSSKLQQAYAWGTLIFFLIVPLIAFITWLIRRVTRVRSRNSYLGWTFGFLWTIGWISLILLITSVGKDTRYKNEKREEIVTTQPQKDRMLVTVSQLELEYSGGFMWMDESWEGFDLKNDTLRLSTVNVVVKASSDQQYHVFINKRSNGKTEEEAFSRAEKIQYSVQSRDSILDLSSGYAIDKESKFRWQQVEVEIQVPVGKKIYFDESVPEKLNPMNVRRRKVTRSTNINGQRVTQRYYTNLSFPYKTGVDYVMELNGNLRDINSKTMTDQINTETVTPDYRYEDNKSKPDTTKISPKEEKRKQLLEELKKLDEEDKSKSSFKKPESMDDDESISVTRSSFNSSNMSLINWF